MDNLVSILPLYLLEHPKETQDVTRGIAPNHSHPVPLLQFVGLELLAQTEEVGLALQSVEVRLAELYRVFEVLGETLVEGH